MEKVAIAKSRGLAADETTISVTRYGNVMASRGSVIPLFVNQIKAHNPITVTDPNMTRFMMSLPDAVDLVLFAFENGRGGDTFVQKAPAAKMGQLARVLRDVFESDTEIQVIGTRHGEKQHESLVNREEMVRAEDLERYYRISCDTRDLNYSLYFERGEKSVSECEDYTSANTHQLSDDELRTLLMQLQFVREEDVRAAPLIRLSRRRAASWREVTPRRQASSPCDFVQASGAGMARWLGVGQLACAMVASLISSHLHAQMWSDLTRTAPEDEVSRHEETN